MAESNVTVTIRGEGNLLSALNDMAAELATMRGPDDDNDDSGWDNFGDGDGGPTD